MATRTASPAGNQPQHQQYRKRRSKAQAREAAEVRRVEGLQVTNAHAAGIDIGSWSDWVCVG